MVRNGVIMIVSCLAACYGVATAQAQVASTAQHNIGVHHPRLTTSVAALLGDGMPHEALLDPVDVFSWLQSREQPAYQVINPRAVRLRSCNIYLYQISESAPDDSLWRERLASYGIRVVKVPGESLNADLFSLARELGRLFPEKQEAISKNLSRELQRRCSPSARSHLAIQHFE